MQPFCDGYIHEVVIPESVETVYDDAFKYGYNLDAIFCKATEKPATWQDNWNQIGASVTWGYTE